MLSKGGRSNVFNLTLMNKLMRIEWVSEWEIECHSSASKSPWHDYVIHELKIKLFRSKFTSAATILGFHDACFSVSSTSPIPTSIGNLNCTRILVDMIHRGMCMRCMVVYGLSHDVHVVIDRDVSTSHCSLRTKERALKSYLPGRTNCGLKPHCLYVMLL